MMRDTEVVVVQSNYRRSFGWIGLSVGFAIWVAFLGAYAEVVDGQAADSVAPAPVMPQYDSSRNLRLPADYRQWIVVGQSLGLSYSEGQGDHQMFNTTLMEPSAYRYFVRTGQFREGTMLALILQGIGSNTLPARKGQFASDVHVLEMAVKDTQRVPEGWAYYAFGGPMAGGYQSAAAPQPKNSCHSCHAEHAARDNVFTQFYGLLNEAAPRGK